ncbi:hypothetical protein LAV_00081 [Sphingobium phage Lacusarx]|uniref:Uncharacterized protein n=1 Tax=Sphingobium phage Lacusarx TaxID=1980139 RepID=A0A1W6DX62_9CAUD|nr:hypothetical protein FDH44_gp081 [Sphingobium phage Lacusarx]ARK07481.1 hypothetical protein LAV_00081 [Sphingobium phage Lacusarx]
MANDSAPKRAKPRAGAKTAPAAPSFTKDQVVIEDMEAPNRGAAVLAEEIWPFGLLKPSVIGENGKLTGPSFFIPDVDVGEKALSSARKRYKVDKIKFTSRKMVGKGPDGVECEGLRIWRMPD